MNDRASAGEYAVGTELSGPARVITAERIEWYDSATRSAAKGAIAQVGDNIHTDEACARNQGLPGTIAHGMISTNWCSSMMSAHFGMHHVARGELRTKFIKPILIGPRCRSKRAFSRPKGGKTAAPNTSSTSGARSRTAPRSSTATPGSS